MPALRVPTLTHNVDAMVATFARDARMFRALPSTYASHGEKIPYVTPDGRLVGYGLPGTGLILSCTLKQLGVTRGIPHVFDRPLMERLRDTMRGNERAAFAVAAYAAALGVGLLDAGKLSVPLIMGAITSFDDIIAAKANGTGEDTFSWRDVNVNAAAGSWNSYFEGPTQSGQFAFSAALAATAPNNTSQGSVFFGLTLPAAADKTYLTSFGYTIAVANWGLILTDVLYQCGGISATTTALQTLGTAALTRWTSGVGVLYAIIATTALSATSSVITVTYTNAQNVGSRSGSITHPNTSGWGTASRFLAQLIGGGFQAGDIGVRSVQSVQFGTALVAGVAALVLHKPLIYTPGTAAQLWIERDIATSLDGLCELVVGSDSQYGCVMPIVYSGASGSAVGFDPRFVMRTVRG